MFRVRKIFDDTTAANQNAIRQVTEMMPRQFPRIRREDVEKLTRQLHDPVKYRYRSVLIVAEDSQQNVRGFAVMLHLPDLNFCYLELLSAAPGRTGGGIGSVLYERVREDARLLGTMGVFFEVSVDDPKICPDPATLRQNMSRLRFYERYGARPIINNEYYKPVREGDVDLYYLVYDDLGEGTRPGRRTIRRIVRAVLERKYGDLCSKSYISSVTRSFRDEQVVLRAPRYLKELPASTFPLHGGGAIALIVNRGHDIHHVREKGYLEAPVRLSSILSELEKTPLFRERAVRAFPERYITAVHDKEYVRYLKHACVGMAPGKSIYPEVFPLRNASRPPKKLPLRAGYYCLDPFTPLNANAYLAARGAVNCALTGADEILWGRHMAYALVRPPGHHAERRAFGGFCYFNSAAVAANYLSEYGQVAVLDLDFHHGNGTQSIFYDRADVLTLSIHGHPNYVYPHFSGFADERGEGEGEGFNVNYPLPEQITAERYRKTLAAALRKIARFKPCYLIVALGVDTAKGDPTGSWSLRPGDFRLNGDMIGRMGIPTLIVQEGGYRTATLGSNVRHFFEGLCQGYETRMKGAAGAREKDNV